MSSANECQSTKHNRQRERAMIMHKRANVFIFLYVDIYTKAKKSK